MINVKKNVNSKKMLTVKQKSLHTIGDLSTILLFVLLLNSLSLFLSQSLSLSLLHSHNICFPMVATSKPSFQICNKFETFRSHTHPHMSCITYMGFVSKLSHYTIFTQSFPLEGTLYTHYDTSMFSLRAFHVAQDYATFRQNCWDAS